MNSLCKGKKKNRGFKCEVLWELPQKSCVACCKEVSIWAVVYLANKYDHTTNSIQTSRVVSLL